MSKSRSIPLRCSNALQARVFCDEEIERLETIIVRSVVVQMTWGLIVKDVASQPTESLPARPASGTDPIAGDFTRAARSFSPYSP